MGRNIIRIGGLNHAGDVDDGGSLGGIGLDSLLLDAPSILLSIESELSSLVDLSIVLSEPSRAHVVDVDIGAMALFLAPAPTTIDIVLAWLLGNMVI